MSWLENWTKILKAIWHVTHCPRCDDRLKPNGGFTISARGTEVRFCLVCANDILRKSFSDDQIKNLELHPIEEGGFLVV
jgi:hypothetical protein